MSISSIGTYGMSAKNLYLAQRAAKKSQAEQALTATNAKISEQQSGKEEFLAYARMSPIERMRAAILEEKGLTEEDVAALTPEEKLKLEEEIKNEIKEKLKTQARQQRGSVVNMLV